MVIIIYNDVPRRHDQRGLNISLLLLNEFNVQADAIHHDGLNNMADRVFGSG